MKSSNYHISKNKIRIADLTLSFLSRSVVLSGNVVETTGLEFKLLALLMSDAGSAVSREVIAAHVFQREVSACSNTINCHMVNLRKKLQRPRDRSMIKTVRGKGYMIMMD